MTPPPLVRVTQLNYSVAGRQVLRQISLSVEAGELLAVLGRNGAGKSTLLHHLSGELGGRGVELFGVPLAQLPPAQVARRRAVLPQHTLPSFAYEVLDVVLLGRIPHGVRETEKDRQIARRMLARVGLEGYEERDILTLSGGEQQRVHLARALTQLEGQEEAASPRPARLLLLDEPTASLDLAHQHATLRLARELCGEGVGVLTILHDLNLAAQYADRLLLLVNGAVLTSGTPDEVLTAENIGAAYGHPVLMMRHPGLGCPVVVSAE